MRLQFPSGADQYGLIKSVTYSDKNVNDEIVNNSETPAKKTDIRLAIEKAEMLAKRCSVRSEYNMK